MNTPNGYNSCGQIRAYFTFYSVPIAAALWCGVPIDKVDEHLSKAKELNGGSFSLEYMPCLEPRCRAIQDAIKDGTLPVCRENGIPVGIDDHVAVARRHVRREDLKAWIAKEFPGDKPGFLFDEIERAAHPNITTDLFLALQAETDTLKIKLEKAEDIYKEMSKELETVKQERNKLIDSPIAESERSSMLKLIIGMAIDAYKYDPNNTRNVATGDKNGISLSLQTRGINIDADTVRKYLNAAKELM